MNWTDIRNVNNNTPIYNVAWLDNTIINYDLVFSESPGVYRESIDWRDKDPALGNTYRHRYTSNHYTWTNSSDYDGDDGYVDRVGYGIAVRDEARANLSAITISGSTYRDLGLKNWEDWKPVYNPYKNISYHLNPGYVMVDTDSGEPEPGPEPGSGSSHFNIDISAAYVGTLDVDKIYLGSEEIWPAIDYSQIPLTFEIVSGGTITWSTKSNSMKKTIQYSKNGAEPISITSNTGESAPSISVEAGDTIEFWGDNTTYAHYSYSNYCNTFKSTAVFEVKGNIMSLLYGDNFIGQTDLPQTNSGATFKNLFSACESLISAEHLILPATSLVHNCYREMFKDCTNLEKGPSIMANKLEGNSCSSMFRECTKLNFIKCLATDISATSCTDSWLYHVSPTGTFVKDPNATWPSGGDGIPIGWTVKDAVL